MAVIGQEATVERDEGISDAALIVSSTSDPDRFAEIFDRHFAEIDRYLARRVGAELADDLAAETFVVAFRARSRYDPAALDARPWLFGIAANLVRRHWRTERRRLRAYARSGVDPLQDATEDADRRVDALAAAPGLAAALARLSPSEREVLLLFAWADLSYDEISRALGVPAGTVRSRLSRARAHVRELVSPNGQVAVESATAGGRNG